MLDLVAIFDPDRTDPAPSVAEYLAEAGLPDPWHQLWEERAAIMEHDGWLPSTRAEALALTEVLRMMKAAQENSATDS